MKCLKIENGKGAFSVDGEGWVELDLIDKDHMIQILTKCLKEKFEMDDPEENDLLNPAHEIIYKKLFSKFTELNKQKTRFQDESESLFKSAFEKYST